MTGDPGYARRAAYYAAEIAAVPAPTALAGLLTVATRVAEVPSGTGHFLDAYAESGVEVLLVDASQAMLDAARATAPTVVTLCRRVEDLTSDDGPADMVVMPNAALNQLAVSSAPSRILTAATRILAPGGSLLAQVMTVSDDGLIQECGFYDPAAPDGALLEDRRIRVAGSDLVRHRRQGRHHDVLQVEFEFHQGTTVADRHAVELVPLTRARLMNAVAVAGLDLVGIAAGRSGLSEVLAQRPAVGAA